MSVTPSVVSALKILGPSLTSTLSTFLAEHHNLSKAAARKQIQRAIEQKLIKVLEGLNFAHNTSFAYLQNQYGTKNFNDNFFAALEETNSVYRLSLAAMRARGGLIPEFMFPAIAGVPIDREHLLDADDIKEQLLKLELLKRTSDGNLSSGGKDELTPKQMQARLQTESTVLSLFYDWLKAQRLVGNSHSIRSPINPPQSGFYQWDLVAPTYIAPLVTRSKNETKQGYIVADIVLGRVLKAHEVQFFVQKCRNIRSVKGQLPFMAFLIAEWFEPDALKLAQQEGVVFTTPRSLFGRKFAEALESFRKTLENKEAELSAQATRIDELLKITEELDTMKSAQDNLRGQLFEVIVGHCVQKETAGNTIHGKKFPDVDDYKKLLDCDVLQVVIDTSVRACECKGYAGTTKVVLSDVEKFYSRVVPAIQRTYPTHNHPVQKYEFWTSGEFDEDALKRLKHLVKTCTAYQTAYYSGKECEAKVKIYGDMAIKEAYQRWFKPAPQRKPKKSREEWEAMRAAAEAPEAASINDKQ